MMENQRVVAKGLLGELAGSLELYVDQGHHMKRAEAKRRGRSGSGWSRAMAYADGYTVPR